jgi:hypothetical protein
MRFHYFNIIMAQCCCRKGQKDASEQSFSTHLSCEKCQAQLLKGQLLLQLFIAALERYGDCNDISSSITNVFEFK